MKILLIPPTHHYNPLSSEVTFLSVSDFPCGYAYLSAALKKAGHEVLGLNPNNLTGYESGYKMLHDQIDKKLKEVKPDLIGLGGLCTDYAFIKDAMQIIRKEAPLAPIVLGGGIVTHDAEFIMNHLKPDFCIIGEGEKAIVELANGESPENILNLSYWEGRKTVFTKVNHDYGDINALSFPDYEPFGIKDMLDNYSMATRLLYRYSRPYPRPFVITTAIGCPFACSFCIDHHRQYRARSITSIIKEIRAMYEKYHFNILIVLDELFAVDKDRLQKFCYGLKVGREKCGWDFDWCFQTHANARLDLESLKMAKEAGCYFFSYGIESASPTVLRSMGKHTKPEQIAEAIKLAGEAKIGFGGNLIFGDPAETEKTICETMDFYFRHCQGEMVFLSAVIPYPGSQIFNYCIERGIIKDKVAYYENITNTSYNMTKMPNGVLSHWLYVTQYIEHSWQWIKAATDVHYEQTNEVDTITSHYKAKMYRVTAKCPFCNETVEYRQYFPEFTKTFMGAGCTSCGRRIRIDLE